MALNKHSGFKTIQRPVVLKDHETFANDDLTPSVAGGNLFICADGNTAPITITNFDGGTIGQIITILSLDAANKTTIASNANMFLYGNWVEVGNATITLMFDGTYWYELSRTPVLILDQTTVQTIANGVPLMTTSVDIDGSDYQLVNKEYVDTALLGLELTEFLSTVNSVVSDGIGGFYKIMDNTVQVAGTNISGTLTTGNDQFYRGYITPVGSPNLTTLYAGVYNIRGNIYKTGTKSAIIYLKLFQRNSGGTETLIATSSNSTALTTTPTPFDLDMFLSTNYTLDATDRLVLKAYANVGASGSDITIKTDVGGTTSAGLTIKAPAIDVESLATAISFTCIAGEALYKGQQVYISGASSGLPQVMKADNTNSAKCRVVGTITTDLLINAIGKVRRSGTLVNVDTRATNLNVNPGAETWSAGDLLWSTTGGGLTKTRPTSGRSVKAAFSLNGSSATDTLLVYPFENPVWSACAVNESNILRMGDDLGVQKTSFRNYSNTEVAYVNSLGGLSIVSMATNWTNAGRTVADLGIITTVDINGGSIDGATIGAASASTIIGTTITANTGVVPDINDGAYLGTTSLMWSDLFLASGGTINWNNGAYILTQDSSELVASISSGLAPVFVVHSTNNVASTNGASIVGKRDRTGGTVLVDDDIFILTARANSGADIAAYASIHFQVDGTPGSSDHPGRIVFKTVPDGGSTNTERMRIDNAGVITTYIGIVPDADDGAYLGVSGTGFSDLFLASGAVINFAASNMTITHSAGALTFSAGLLTATDLTLNTYDSGGLQFKTTFADYVNFYSAYASTEGENRLQFLRSRGTLASPTSVANADVLGGVFFQGHDGSGFHTAAIIRGEVDGTPSDGTDMPGRLTFWTTPDASATPAERMRITNGGLVGIGRTPTTYPLEIAGDIQVIDTTAHSLFIATNTGGTAYIGIDRSTAGGLGGAYTFNLCYSGSYDMIFATANQEWMRLSSAGVLTTINGTHIMVGGATLEAGSTNSIGIANGTAPNAHVDNEVILFSTDSGDATATLGIYAEQAVEALGTFTASNKFKININGTLYWIQLDAV